MYKCLRCGYTNDLKSNFKRHLRRKNTCKPKLKNISIGDIYNYYFNTYKNSSLAKLPKCLAKLPKCLAKLGKVYKCIFCNKEFKHSSSKSTHEKHRCKIKKEKENYENLQKLVKLLNEQLKEKEKELNLKLKKQKKELNLKLKKKDKQISELMKKVGVNIGTQNIQNIQNNIKILAYNKTDMTHLKDKDYIKFLSHSNFCVPHMIKKLHFDPRKPENHNIYISNLKNNFVMVYNGDQWNIRDRNEVINDMIEDNTNLLEDKIEDWLEKGKQYPQIMKKFNRYLEKKENDIVIDKIKQEIKFILYNNREIVNNKCS